MSRWQLSSPGPLDHVTVEPKPEFRLVPRMKLRWSWMCCSCFWSFLLVAHKRIVTMPWPDSPSWPGVVACRHCAAAGKNHCSVALVIFFWYPHTSVRLPRKPSWILIDPESDKFLPLSELIIISPQESFLCFVLHLICPNAIFYKGGDVLPETPKWSRFSAAAPCSLPFTFCHSTAYDKWWVNTSQVWLTAAGVPVHTFACRLCQTAVCHKKRLNKLWTLSAHSDHL